MIKSCAEEPHYGCLEYKQKESCSYTEKFCTSSELVCMKKEVNCVNLVETCVEYDFENNCIRTQRECKHFLEACVEWGYKCVGDSYESCEVKKNSF